MSRVCLSHFLPCARSQSRLTDWNYISSRRTRYGLTKHIAVATRMLAPGFLRRARAMTPLSQAPMTYAPIERSRGGSQPINRNYYYGEKDSNFANWATVNLNLSVFPSRAFRGVSYADCNVSCGMMSSMGLLVQVIGNYREFPPFFFSATSFLKRPIDQLSQFDVLWTSLRDFPTRAFPQRRPAVIVSTFHGWLNSA